MSDDKEARKLRNMKLLGLTPENLEEHSEKEQARAIAYEGFRKLKQEGPPDLSLPEDKWNEVTRLMDEILDLTGGGGVYIMPPHEMKIIRNFAVARGFDEHRWLGEAVLHFLNCEEAYIQVGGGPITFTMTMPERAAETKRPKKAADGSTVQ